MPRTDTVVIGGGQAGLATSRYLREAGRDHVVLERGRVGERWSSERWDSLRLLTPNWMTRLPGWRYTGPDPDGFMTATDVARLLSDYAASFGAPVRSGTEVERVERRGDGFRVTTDRGVWTATDVVVATGATGIPCIPTAARDLAPETHQIAANRYRNPGALPPGGVLVVGASASGLQIADELRRAGRDVVLSVGRHARMPRRYRGLDVMWWMDRIGMFDTTIDEVADPRAARRAPSLQLSGQAGRERLDLGTVARGGVTLVGRLAGASGGRVHLATDLPGSVAGGDARMRRVLDRIDRYIDTHGLTREVLDPDAPAPITVDPGPRVLDLVSAGITTVVWATGYRPHMPWLRAPVFDARREIVHRRGVTPVAGLYVLGLPFLHHRNSTFIDGVGRDARFVAGHLAGRIPSCVPARADATMTPEPRAGTGVGARRNGGGTGWSGRGSTAPVSGCSSTGTTPASAASSSRGRSSAACSASRTASR